MVFIIKKITKNILDFLIEISIFTRINPIIQITFFTKELIILFLQKGNLNYSSKKETFLKLVYVLIMKLYKWRK